ncbi:hypothetical protein FHG87_021309 [Trinorchestia longiramus]|nr:hypothetical protein FHG87_021309 [Trinorchestia longiramus]
MHITSQTSPTFSLTLPHSPSLSLTLPHSPSLSLTLPHSTLTLPSLSLTFPHSTLTLPSLSLTLPSHYPRWRTVLQHWFSVHAAATPLVQCSRCCNTTSSVFTLL